MYDIRPGTDVARQIDITTTLPTDGSSGSTSSSGTIGEGNPPT
jgi:hypothetical protein